MPELLSRTQVAALTGRHPNTIADWARTRGIRATRTRRGDAYPAALCRHIHRREQQAARKVADALRLHRFITNPLNRPTAADPTA